MENQRENKGKPRGKSKKESYKAGKITGKYELWLVTKQKKIIGFSKV